MNLYQFNPRPLVDLGLANGWIRMPCQAEKRRKQIRESVRRLYAQRKAAGLTCKGKVRKEKSWTPGGIAIKEL